MSLKKLKDQLQIEIDAAYLYKQLAAHEKDHTVIEILSKMSAIEHHHAQRVLQKIHAINAKFIAPSPSWRARLQVKLGRCFGFGFIFSNLAAMEAQAAKGIIQKKQQLGEKITGLENIHLNIVQNISKRHPFAVGGSLLTRLEGKHKSVGGNELRAAVLGANDGLVSNLSLVMGVTGASSNAHEILIAGIAGLLAGAISMALGEWLSVQSSRELYQKQVEIEAEELADSPEEEKHELALLYQAKGIAAADALKLAGEVLANKETALDSLVREELGIDKDELGGSAWKAAFVSFFLFAFGALIPVLPYLLGMTSQATCLSLLLSAVGLFIIGASITLFTGRNLIYSGVRQVCFGLTAAAITYFIGKAIGITILG